MRRVIGELFGSSCTTFTEGADLVVSVQSGEAPYLSHHNIVTVLLRLSLLSMGCVSCEKIHECMSHMTADIAYTEIRFEDKLTFFNGQLHTPNFCGNESNFFC